MIDRPNAPVAINFADITAAGRGVVMRAASIRHEPRKRGGRIVKLDEGTAITLRQKSGPWWQISYRDPQTGDITDGWIYETLIRKIS